MKSCHRCSAPWPTLDQAGFNNTCEGCGTPVHCCANCSSYQPRAQRRCDQLDTPAILDGASANRCEMFRFRIQAAAGEDSAATVEDVRRQLLESDESDRGASSPSWDQLFGN